MFCLRGCLLAAVVLCLAVCGGCGFAPKSQVAACQSQNRILTEQNKAQLAEIDNLKVHSRSVEDKLIRAEEDLARLDDQNGRDRRKLANLGQERAQLESRFAGLPGDASAIAPGVSTRLADLSKRYPSLHYDPQTGISKLDTDVLFESGDVKLNGKSQNMLAEFAEILQSPDAQQLKVLVVGHTDSRGIKGREVRKNYRNNWHLSTGRAVAVAEHLRRAGMPEERMGVAGFGPHQPISPNDSADARHKNRRVEIFVVGPDTPVVGWTETLGNFYR